MSLTEYYVEKRKAMEEFWLQSSKILKELRKIKYLELDAPIELIKDGYVNTLVYQTAFDEIESELEKFRCKIYKTKYVPVKASPISGIIRYFEEDSETKGTDE